MGKPDLVLVPDEEAPDWSGPVVVVDVLRAFTTAACALADGVNRILLVADVEEARALRRAFPDSFCMGEEGGLPLPDFEAGNSPLDFLSGRFAGRTAIHRSTAGTRGVVRCGNASAVCAASFLTASATLRWVLARKGASVGLVATGIGPEGEGDADLALFDFLRGRMKDPGLSPAAFLERVRTSSHGRRFVGPPGSAFQAGDLELATRVDLFDFAMEVRKEEGHPTLRRPHLSR